MCYIPPSQFGQGKIIYANHLPWYIVVIVVFLKSCDKWLKNKLTWRNDRVCENRAVLKCNTTFWG
jgi:hypothetical protein